MEVLRLCSLHLVYSSVIVHERRTHSTPNRLLLGPWRTRDMDVREHERRQCRDGMGTKYARLGWGGGEGGGS